MFANFHSKSPINFSGYNNAEVDRLLLIGRTSLDENKRKAAYCDLIKILNDDVVWLWTGSNIDFAITRGQRARHSGAARRRGAGRGGVAGEIASPRRVA